MLKTPKSFDSNTWCSIVPLMEPSKVTTSGFKWNLSDDQIKFGSFISTSNQFDPNADEVFIQTSKPVLFSMKLL